MGGNLDEIRARARLLLAAEKWRDLTQLLEKDVPMLISEVEQLRLQLKETLRGEGRPRLPGPMVSQPPAKDRGESQLLSVREFAHTTGVTVACVRSWTLKRKINFVKLGRIVRIPRTEVKRLIDEGMIPSGFRGTGPNRAE